MRDEQIIDLYWARSQDAIRETQDKYGRYCHSIAWHILEDEQDCQECVNDTWMRAWNAMPEARPDRLPVFLGKITRNLSLDRWKHDRAIKRGFGQTALALEELAECIPDRQSVEQAADQLVLVQVLNDFLRVQSREKRRIFLLRYWYLFSVQEIALELSVTESKVKMTLLRMRQALRQMLEKEDISL